MVFTGEKSAQIIYLWFDDKIIQRAIQKTKKSKKLLRKRFTIMKTDDKKLNKYLN